MTYYKKQYIADVNVYEAAKERIRIIYNEFEAVNIAFSGGKDSTVLVNLCIDVAKELGKTPVNVFCIDFEALYKSTHDITEYYGNHPDVNLEWICLPIHLRNAVSQFQPHWICWDNTCKDKWIRQLPKKSISDIKHYDFFREGMEFENFIEEYAIHKSENGNKKTCTLVGIRSDESLNRFRTIVNTKKSKYKDYQWTTKNSNNVYSAYPIYDWKTTDIWTYFGKTGYRYNEVYDLMYKAGVPISQQRLCQPFGDDQRSGLWLYKIIEPHTWNLLIERVNGVNFGGKYSKSSGNVLGNNKIDLPEGHTWRSYSYLLLRSMPRPLAVHYRRKIYKFIMWYYKRGLKMIPDEADAKLESSKKVASWRRICKVLLKNDYWCKGLSFAQTKYDTEEKLRILNELSK